MTKKTEQTTSAGELPKPLYAAAGAGELAYQQLRRLPAVAARTLRTAGQTADELRQRFGSQDEPVRSRMRASAQRSRVAMRNRATAAQERAAAGYRNLVARGERVMAERGGALRRHEPAPVEVIVGPVQPDEPRQGKPAAGEPATGEAARKPEPGKPGKASKPGGGAPSGKADQPGPGGPADGPTDTGQ